MDEATEVYYTGLVLIIFSLSRSFQHSTLIFFSIMKNFSGCGYDVITYCGCGFNGLTNKVSLATPL